jgi:prepilin-type N-terminal cleavage/methylation domain-containing protein
MYKYLNVKKKGFTLSEMMAVVVIVAILAAVGIGSYKKAVERSHFNEGLVAANTVMQAAERYYNEQVMLSGTLPSNTPPTLSKLDVGFENARPCTSASNYCVKTKYFEVTLHNGYTIAKRMKGSTAHNYSITVYPESFGSNRKKGTVCTFTNANGKDLCVTMGYSNCNSSTCSK